MSSDILKYGMIGNIDGLTIILVMMKYLNVMESSYLFALFPLLLKYSIFAFAEFVSIIFSLIDKADEYMNPWR